MSYDQDDKVKIMKCSLCGWTTPRWTRNKKGKSVPGGQRLLNHFEIAHHDEYMRILEGTDDNH